MESTEPSHQRLPREQSEQQPEPSSVAVSSLTSALASSTEPSTTLPQSTSLPLRTTTSTPVSSPGLFSPAPRYLRDNPVTSFSESSTPAPFSGVSFLHPLQTYRVRETHKALIDSDTITGRKMINQYEVIEEIGRGVHGKVKLARNVQTGDNVAIKIIPRFSKKRRLGKVTARSPEDKTKKEIAILKKIRHPNVVALLEVIDDPELKKIYMVLEHVELGEIVWRKKGVPYVFMYERRRAERDIAGEPKTAEEIRYDRYLERRQAIKNIKRAKMAEQFQGPTNYWSVEHGAADEQSSVSWSRISSKDDFGSSESRPASPTADSQTSRRDSIILPPPDLDEEILWGDDIQTPGPLTADVDPVEALDGTMYGPYSDDGGFRARSPSMADSIISHMSSVDLNLQVPDAFADDYSYVPCFTFDQARGAFRDTVLGLEYLHYQGVVHRDIKPANLLWSRDRRVKISDFGVSYFGRPIRDGEPEDLVSESEAKDFDNDLELAKTVGTPAFFAPELCYTDPEKEQPKVSEQIDVWSLGVTLYCLIYARIPFLAEDEFQMFRKIATEDVYIPTVRLAPVDPSTSPDTQNLVHRQNTRPYRDDGDVVYEEVDKSLYDLLQKMLVKNPEKRIRLRDIKRHPWVLQGISNPVGWLDDTDPSRPSDGRKIQVDERDLSSAVVPLTFLEKARSVVRKAVGKVINPLGERTEVAVKSRRRATSSAASSIHDGLHRSMPATPHSHAERRTHFHDEYFVKNMPMSPTLDDASIIATVTGSDSDEYDPMATVSAEGGQTFRKHRHGLSEASLQDVHAGAARLWHHQSSASHGKISSNQFLDLAPAIGESYYEGRRRERPSRPTQGILRLTRDSESAGSGTSRSDSIDRAGSGVFCSNDKRAHAQTGVSKTNASGTVQGLGSPIPLRPADVERDRYHGAHGSPLSSSPLSMMARYQHGQPKSDPNFQHNKTVGVHPMAAAALHMADNRASAPQTMSSSPRYLGLMHPNLAADGNHNNNTVVVTGSSDDIADRTGRPMRGNTATTVQSSSTDSIECCVGTPLTCPSESTSPTTSSHPGKNTSERMLAFQSDPSLPALLSGASSVSADLEAELLGQPGVLGTQALLQTTDSLTPPALSKESESEFPISSVFTNPPAMSSGAVRLQVEANDSLADTEQDANADDDDDGSDDGFLQMAKSKKHKTLGFTSPVPRRPPFEARRRDTALSNISTASDETAKRVVIHGDD